MPATARPPTAGRAGTPRTAPARSPRWGRGTRGDLPWDRVTPRADAPAGARLNARLPAGFFGGGRRGKRRELNLRPCRPPPRSGSADATTGRGEAAADAG